VSDEREYTREEMRKACADNYAAGRATALAEAAEICESLRSYAGANGAHHYLACAAAIRGLQESSDGG